MELEVSWTNRAKNNYTKILEYIVSEFGEKSGKDYHQRVEQLITLYNYSRNWGRNNPNPTTFSVSFFTDARQFSTLLIKVCFELSILLITVGGSNI